MLRCDSRLTRFRNGLSILLLTISTAAAQADERPADAQRDTPPLGALIEHGHAPMTVRSKPVIERLPVKVIEPVDLKIARSGHLFVADRKAECVFRLDSDGSVSLAVQQLPDIQRIQLDEDNNLFVLTSSEGASAVHQVTPTGRRVVLQQLEFPASSFVRLPSGETIVVVENSGRMLAFDEAGEIVERSVLPAVIHDVALNSGRQVQVLLSSGHVVMVPADGQFEYSGFATLNASRLLLRQDGSMACLDSPLNERPALSVVVWSDDRPTKFDVIANVPQGTRAVGFDALGNLCLVNPDLRAVTKVTSRFEIPCPHCEKPTLLILDPDAPGQRDHSSRKF